MFGKLFWIQIILFGAYGFLTALHLPFQDSFFFHTLTSLIILTICLPLSGINLTIILERVFTKHFDAIERINIAAILALVVMPLLLTLEYSQLHILSSQLPVINAFIIFCISLVIIQYFPQEKQENTFDNKKSAKNIRHSVIFAATVYALFVFLIITDYYPLPDLDPYYWLSTYGTAFQQNTITAINLYRPLFSSLAYIFHQTAGVDLYAFFKYVIPLLTLLVLLPATLVAKLFRRPLDQLAILFLPLASASFILYLQIPIPQAILNICVIFFIFFLVYSAITQKKFFYFFGGVIIFGAYFYHEAVALIFLVWLAVTLYRYRSTLISNVTHNKPAAFLLFLLILSYAQIFFSPLCLFLFNWISIVAHSVVNWQTNFAFPATYVNIDGNSVGWGNWLGVLKYYAFYAGPAVILISIATLYFLKTSSEFRQKFFNKRKSEEFLVLGGVFILFFSIAEVLPRFFNIALLPERAWGFAGLFFITALVPILLEEKRTIKPWIVILFLITITINMGGALYINSLKKYLITPAQITSAEWIKHHLPPERILFTSGNRSLLTIHSQSKTTDVDNPEFYSDIRVFDTAINTFSNKQWELKEDYQEYLKQTFADLEKLEEKSVSDYTADIIKEIDAVTQASQMITATLQKYIESQNKQINGPIYIFYAKSSDKNPYAKRPYLKGTVSQQSVFVFDEYPDRFQRVYELPNDEVVIWQLIQN